MKTNLGTWLRATTFCGFLLTLPLTARADYRTPSWIEFQAPVFTVNEAQGTASITVIRKGDFRESTSVAYQLKERTATAGEDYKATGGTLVFPAGQCIKTFTVAILSDTAAESDEGVELVLSDPEPNAQIITPTATLTIKDAAFAEAPRLLIQAAAGGAISLSWPADRAECVLQRSENPQSAVWTNVPRMPTLVDGRLSVTESTAGPMFFYRLVVR